MLQRQRHRRMPQGLVDLTGQVASYGPAQQALAATETLRGTKEDEAEVRLYDLVDHTWTMPINLIHAQNFHLRKVVYVCSTCKWTSAWPNQFSDHVKQARSQQKAHLKAEVLPVVTAFGAAYRCTGCSSAFSVPGRAQMHIDMLMRQSDGHKDARLDLARRFALEAPVAPAKTQAVVAVASQLERTVVPHKRSGRHRRHQRSTHGD